MIYHVCENPLCGAEIEDPNEEVFSDDGVLICEYCLRDSIGLSSTPGANYTLHEIVDALTIERHTAAEWYKRRALKAR